MTIFPHQVGDILLIPVNKSFPCDLVMLSSADSEGICYITTANLDGETNLKVTAALTVSLILISLLDLTRILSFKLK